MKYGQEPIRIIFAKNLKKHRENIGYSQEKLAEKAGLSVQTIKDIEGERRWISDDSLSKLAKALNTPVFLLFLPDKYEKGKKYQRAALKSLASLKTKIKTYLDEQFEDAISSGDFS